ncbi:MAG: epoxide hydrolase 1, partial [Sphingomonadaceae bacterium]|nr:epoxide hydrolase 1 [Sphingomonadaceae bacterium]
DWQAGSNLGYMRDLTAYWMDGFDWRAQERAMNEWPHYKTVIDGIPVHFIHVKGKGPNPMPLVLNHGWPWTFWDFRKVLGPLSDPVAYGGEAADAFDVIVPSVPGFAFSSPMDRPDVSAPAIADMLVTLMNRLGYGRFATHGADLGAFVAAMLGHRHPERLVGVHLQHLLTFRKPQVAPEDYEPGEEQFIEERKRFRTDGMGYHEIQRTRPQTISFAMNDSPVGLAAWLIEKRQNWGGTGGKVESAFSKDDLLTTVCLYWFTQTYLSAAWHYRVSTLPEAPKPLIHDRLPCVEVPVAAQQFMEDIVYRPRAFAEKHFNIQRWNVEERGGHFGAFERPDAVVDDLRAFFRDLS